MSHYGSKGHRKCSKLVFVLYKHTTEDNFELELTSIQNCTLIHPDILKLFLVSYQHVLNKEFEDKELEKWYEVTASWSGSSIWDINIINIKDISDSKNWKLKVH